MWTMLMFFVSDAFADAGSAQSGGVLAFLPLIGFVVILYFLIIRPQQKRQKQHQELIASIKKGDKVVTNSGIIATVSKVVSEHEVVLEIASGVHCKFVKSAIASTVPSTDGVTTSAKEEKPTENVRKEEENSIISEAKQKGKAALKKVTTKNESEKKQ